MILVLYTIDNTVYCKSLEVEKLRLAPIWSEIFSGSVIKLIFNTEIIFMCRCHILQAHKDVLLWWKSLK